MSDPSKIKGVYQHTDEGWVQVSVSPQDGAHIVDIKRRSGSDQVEWLLHFVAVLAARVGALERLVNPQEDTVSEEHPMPRVTVEQTLLGTDDASVWAAEFCRIFNGKMVVVEESDETARVGALDPGTMVGWFANAMQTAINVYERRALRRLQENQATANVSEGAREAFVEGVEDGREPPA